MNIFLRSFLLLSTFLSFAIDSLLVYFCGGKKEEEDWVEIFHGETVTYFYAGPLPSHGLNLQLMEKLRY